jgi:hypothetical protein
VVTTVRAGSHGPGTKLVSLKRQNFKAITRQGLEGALNLTDWSKVYNIHHLGPTTTPMEAAEVMNQFFLEKVDDLRKKALLP